MTATDTTHADSAPLAPLGGLPATMQALTQSRYGSADVLSPDRVDVPTPAADQVLIRVGAAAVDRGTCHLLTGTPYLIRLFSGLRRPKQPIPGLDVAGTVVAVGDEVERFAVGDEVFGIASGSVAEYTVASEDKLTHRPDGVSVEAAAASTVSGITALQALTDVGGVEAGQRVLIIGASGGVGSFAVQLAKAYGAEVTGVASTRNLDLLRSLGADHVIDYTTDDVDDTDHRYDLILDIGGRNSVRRLRRALSATGTLVIVGGEGGDPITGGLGRQLRAMLLSPFVGQRLTTMLSTEHHSFVERLAEHLSSGAVTPAIGARHHLADAAAAIARLDAGLAQGKSVILIDDEAADVD